METGFFIGDNNGNVWKNGRQVSRQSFGKLLTKKQMEQFEKAKEMYLNALG